MATFWRRSAAIICVFLVAVVAAQASPILITNCWIGGTPAECNGRVSAFGGYSFPASNSFRLSIASGADGVFGDESFYEALAILTYDFAGAGPARMGRMHVRGLAEADGGSGAGGQGGGSASFSAPGVGCSRGFDPPCFRDLFLDVLLGAPLRASVGASGHGLGVGGGGGDAWLTIELFETDGQTPVEVIDAADVPEPAAAILGLSGLLAMIVQRLLARRLSAA